jgi:hypothetical protein
MFGRLVWCSIWTDDNKRNSRVSDNRICILFIKKINNNLETRKLHSFSGNRGMFAGGIELDHYFSLKQNNNYRSGSLSTAPTRPVFFVFTG